MLENQADFVGQTVLDVGAGTGILSFFAARAGAKRVYAVEASSMATKAEKLAKGNNLSDVVKVVNKRVEEVELDERVDVLISEPLGIALVNERMLESYIRARDALLKPGGKMYPDRATLFAAPFSDEQLFQEQFTKSTFWAQSNFYGVDLTALREDAHTFYFSQPVVGPVAPHTICCTAAAKAFDFSRDTLESIQRFEVPLNFTMQAITQVHVSFTRAKRAHCRFFPPTSPLAQCLSILASARSSVPPLCPFPAFRFTGSLSGSTVHSPGRSARSFSTPRRSSRLRTGTRCAAYCVRRSRLASGTSLAAKRSLRRTRPAATMCT
jgi:ubiquinone/menaquinone biosynthesis C-methylase UbiE